MNQHTEISGDISRRATAFSPRIQIAITAGISLLLIAGVWIFHRMEDAPVAPPARLAPPGTFLPTKTQWDSLKTAPVLAMSFRSEEITDGVIAYNDDTTTPVFSPYSGQVTRVIAKLGDAVKKGDPLMAVAATEFAQSRSNLLVAHAQVTLATANEKRLHGLYEAKAAALKDWLQSQSDLATAKANLLSARNQLSILGKSEEEINAIENESGALAVSPEALVRAPVSGTVTQRQVGNGQNIQSAVGGAAVPVYTIGNLSSVWLVANVREADAPLMRVGQSIEVHVLALPGQVFKAKIAWVAPAVDPNTHRLPVRAEIGNKDGMLKPMMFANFSIVTGNEVQALGVPQSAVVYEGSDAHVFVANADHSLAVRPIKAGRISGSMLEVTAGLAAGEKIVTHGALFIDRATLGD
ncbi:MAG: efflux RND transporter periplasmic adaptor subunit [Gallionella sp.]|nr:efflux RND transporter periplasmic adaptor subunit [Gallionella sp.]